MNCVQKLETFQNFKQKIESNQEYLNSLFQDNSLDINEDQKNQPDYPEYFEFRTQYLITQLSSFYVAKNAQYVTKASQKSEKLVSTLNECTRKSKTTFVTSATIRLTQSLISPDMTEISTPINLILLTNEFAHIALKLFGEIHS